MLKWKEQKAAIPTETHNTSLNVPPIPIIAHTHPKWSLFETSNEYSLAIQICNLTNENSRSKSTEPTHCAPLGLWRGEVKRLAYILRKEQGFCLETNCQDKQKTQLPSRLWHIFRPRVSLAFLGAGKNYPHNTRSTILTNLRKAVGSTILSVGDHYVVYR